MMPKRMEFAKAFVANILQFGITVESLDHAPDVPMKKPDRLIGPWSYSLLNLVKLCINP
jgi:hypothetical protein